jgi:hypothetical protein
MSRCLVWHCLDPRGCCQCTGCRWRSPRSATGQSTTPSLLHPIHIYTVQYMSPEYLPPLYIRFIWRDRLMRLRLDTSSTAEYSSTRTSSVCFQIKQLIFRFFFWILIRIQYFQAKKRLLATLHRNQQPSGKTMIKRYLQRLANTT